MANTCLGENSVILLNSPYALLDDYMNALLSGVLPDRARKQIGLEPRSQEISDFP